MSQRSDALQLMRFVAAALVLYAHHTVYFAERVNASFPWSSLGPPGVVLFFIISGLVMVVSTQRVPRDGAGARSFMTRRLLRVAPMYWLATTLKVGIALVLPQLVVHNSFDVWRSVASYFFIPTFNDAGHVQPVLGVGWTLIHEMYFYLLFALALWLGRWPALWVSLFIAGMALLGLVWSPASAPMQIATNPINLNFVIGMLAGETLVARQHSARWRWLPIGLLLALAAVGWLKPGGLMPYVIQPVALVLAAAMLCAYSWRLPAVMQVFVRLGESSYALYLFHTFYSTAILLLLHRLMPQWSPWGNIWLSVAVAIPMGHAIYLWLERPVTARLGAWLLPVLDKPATRHRAVK
jgi:exopolysaccharide production protein ExoZ